MAIMGAAMATALLCIHRNRNTGQYRLAAHRSSLGAARMWVIPESAAWGGGFFFFVLSEIDWYHAVALTERSSNPPSNSSLNKHVAGNSGFRFYCP